MNAPVSLSEARAVLSAGRELKELDLATLPVGANVLVETYSSEYQLQVFDPVSGLVVCRSTSAKWGAMPAVAKYAGLTIRAGLDPERTNWICSGRCMVLHGPRGWVTSSNVESVRLVPAFPDPGEFRVAIEAYVAEQEAQLLRIILNPLSDSARAEVRCAIAEFPKAGRAMLIEFFLAATRERKMKAAIAAFHAQCRRYWDHLFSSDLEKPLTRLDWERLQNLFRSLDFEVPELAS